MVGGNARWRNALIDGINQKLNSRNCFGRIEADLIGFDIQPIAPVTGQHFDKHGGETFVLTALPDIAPGGTALALEVLRDFYEISKGFGGVKACLLE